MQVGQIPDTSAACGGAGFSSVCLSGFSAVSAALPRPSTALLTGTTAIALGTVEALRAASARVIGPTAKRRESRLPFGVLRNDADAAGRTFSPAHLLTRWIRRRSCAVATAPRSLDLGDRNQYCVDALCFNFRVADHPPGIRQSTSTDSAFPVNWNSNG
jgi:hypothetical protein